MFGVSSLPDGTRPDELSGRIVPQTIRPYPDKISQDFITITHCAAHRYII